MKADKRPNPSIGERFLKEVRRLGGSVSWTGEELRAVREANRREFIEILRGQSARSPIPLSVGLLSPAREAQPESLAQKFVQERHATSVLPWF